MNREDKKYIEDGLLGCNEEELHEDVSKQNILDALDNEFGQEDVYMWSTYILPNGHFLNPENSSWFEDNDEIIQYEHCDFEDWAWSKGYKGQLQTIYDNCIKMNVTSPYLGMPDKARPTPEQLRAIKKILNNQKNFYFEQPEWDNLQDDAEKMGPRVLGVFSPKGDKLFDLDVSDADDIVRAITQAYVRGYLTEKIVKKELDIPVDVGLSANYETIEDDSYNTNWYYFGDCISTVDGNYPDEDDEEYWDYYGPGGADEDAPYWDATEMAQALEKAKVYLGKKKLVDAPKEALAKNVVCGVIEDRGIGFVYNIDNDIHYFFDIDAITNNKNTNNKTKHFVGFDEDGSYWDAEGYRYTFHIYEIWVHDDIKGIYKLQKFNNYDEALKYFNSIKDTSESIEYSLTGQDFEGGYGRMVTILRKRGGRIIETISKCLQEKIVQIGNKWQVQSEKGKNLGTYNTRKEAEKRLKQVEYFKHLDEDYKDDFINRTTQHIARVNKYAKKIDKSYPNHDSDKFNELFDGYSLMNKKDVSEEEQKKIDDATYKHVINNEHHCEHWCDTKDVEGFTRNNPNPHGCLDCTKMPESAMEEMCCDWCAMSEEFNNTPFEWFDKVKDTRWHFNEEQEKFILDMLHKLWDNE